MLGFGDVSEQLRRSTVQVIAGGRSAFGSGVIWPGDGIVVTNAHVARHEQARIQLWDGRDFPAHLTARDPRRDLAVLRTNASNLVPAAVGDSAAVRPGELVIAVGNPWGFAGALSTGVVHSTGVIPGMGRQQWIRANVRLAPGNSGGPLADAHGRVIGINTAILNGLGIAAPVNEVAALLRRGARPTLGVTVCPVTAGLRILEVEHGSAADMASLRPGDTLLISLDALGEAVDSARERLTLRFIRGDPARVRQTVVRLQTRAVAA